MSMGSTNFSVSSESSGRNDRGDGMYSPPRLFNMHNSRRNGRSYAADAYDEGNGNLHDDSYHERSTEYIINGHDRHSPTPHNYNADTYRRGSTSRNYPASGHRDHHGRHNQPHLEPSSRRRYAEEPSDSSNFVANGHEHSRSLRAHRTPYDRPRGNGNLVERPSESPDYRRGRFELEEFNRGRGHLEDAKTRRRERGNRGRSTLR
ncbi:hypothetical protein B0H16DRAFT_1519392 [Mycena metata]|uniref:Uncharacterized protein n=1 Tax=Mycena metata TaxID=1033252 RepID=A0AAD7JMY9_9AGAR|nr:hypothetical protein B0H16DRAFT_1519392 [Mycena metata]